MQKHRADEHGAEDRSGTESRRVKSDRLPLAILPNGVKKRIQQPLVFTHERLRGVLAPRLTPLHPTGQHRQRHADDHRAAYPDD
jgi:hypothetical protein